MNPLDKPLCDHFLDHFKLKILDAIYLWLIACKDIEGVLISEFLCLQINHEDSNFAFLINFVKLIVLFAIESEFYMSVARGEVSNR